MRITLFLKKYNRGGGMSLRQTVLKFYDSATNKALKEIEKKHYVTSRECESYLQREFARYEKYYAKQGIEPFSDEFVGFTFNEFLEKIRNLPDIKIKNITDDLVLPGIVGEEIFSFSEGDLKIVYNLLRIKYEGLPP